MQTSAQIFRAGASPAVAARAARRSSVVRCQAPQGLSPIQEAAKGAALAAATLGLVLGSGMPALAAKPTPSAFEQRAAYEQELLESLKARGKDLPALTSSPEGTVAAPETKAAPLKLGPIEKVTIDTPEAVPTPAPPVPATAVAPKPTVAPAPAPAPAPVVKAEAPAPVPAPVVPKAAPPPNAFGSSSGPSAAAAASPLGNQGLIAGAAVATVAIAAVAVAGSQGNLEGAVAGNGAAPASSSPAASGSSSVPPNVAEARAWIAAWKSKHGK